MEHRKKPDSILGCISGPSVNIWFMHSVFNLFKSDHDNRFGADWLLVFGPYIHHSRNELQQQFLTQTDREWLFMVDNDMVFKPGDVEALFNEADVRGPGIYAGPYLIENAQLTCGPWATDESVAGYKPMSYHPMFALPKKTVQVGVVGGGFTLIHREVFETLGPGAFTQIDVESGEDISFCWRAREAGYIPWLVPTSDPGHHKDLVLYPSQTVRNMIGEEVNLVEATDELQAMNEELIAKGGAG